MAARASPQICGWMIGSNYQHQRLMARFRQMGVTPPPPPPPSTVVSGQLRASMNELYNITAPRPFIRNDVLVREIGNDVFDVSVCAAAVVTTIAALFGLI